MSSRYTTLLLGELRYCANKPGIWSLCPPNKEISGNLYTMIKDGLVRWRDGRGGYEITEKGQALLPAPKPLQSYCPTCGRSIAA